MGNGRLPLVPPPSFPPRSAQHRLAFPVGLAAAASSPSFAAAVGSRGGGRRRVVTRLKLENGETRAFPSVPPSLLPSSSSPSSLSSSENVFRSSSVAQKGTKGERALGVGRQREGIADGGGGRGGYGFLGHAARAFSPPSSTPRSFARQLGKKMHAA